MFKVWPRSKVWSRILTSEVCPKFVWSGLHDSDHHWSAVLPILITYIIMYFLSLFGYMCMFVFVVWQINCLSLWVRSLTYDVWQWKLQSDVWSMSEVQNPKSEKWCLKSTIGSLMYEVWRNLKFDVRRLFENCLKLCPKSEVLHIQANIVIAQIVTTQIGYNTIRLWTPKCKTPFVGYFPENRVFKIQLCTDLHDLLKQGARFRRRLIAADYVITLTGVLVTEFTQPCSS